MCTECCSQGFAVRPIRAYPCSQSSIPILLVATRQSVPNHLVLFQRVQQLQLASLQGDLTIDEQESHFLDYDSITLSSFLLQFVQQLAIMCLCLNGRSLVQHQSLNLVRLLSSVQEFQWSVWKNSLNSVWNPITIA